MPSRVRIPKYRLHKARGLAVVTIRGRDHYLGQYGSEESRRKYGELIAQLAAGANIRVPVQNLLPAITVEAVVLAFLRHAQQHYQKNGKVTDEVACIKSATTPLVDLYGATPAAEFNGPALKAVRQQMIDNGWSRTYINKSIGRIRLVFRHALGNDMIPAEVVTKLAAVEPLLAGRSAAIERPGRAPVPAEQIEAVRAEVNQHTRDLIDLAILTGARPGELCGLTGEQIDRRGDVWTATLADHKMIHKGRVRVLAFGPQSQLILRRYLKADPTERLFPIQRKTFSANIKAACERLKIPVWTAHWLRHNVLTEVRAAEGLDAAQVVAGHSDARTTQHYAAPDTSRIEAIARKRG